MKLAALRRSDPGELQGDAAVRRRVPGQKNWIRSRRPISTASSASWSATQQPQEYDGPGNEDIQALLDQ